MLNYLKVVFDSNGPSTQKNTKRSIRILVMAYKKGNKPDNKGQTKVKSYFKDKPKKKKKKK